MSSQTSILDVPPEILEMIFQRISATKDVRNCQIACEGYTDPRISNILSLIQFHNEGIFILLTLKIFLPVLTLIIPIYNKTFVLLWSEYNNP